MWRALRRALAEHSFRRKWRNPVGLGIGKSEGVDADGLEIVTEDGGIGITAERTDDQPRSIAAARNVRLDAVEQVGVLLLEAPEAAGQVIDVRTACELQPDLRRIGRDGALDRWR